VKCALRDAINAIPQEAFTGLATKSRITVTTSACWEKTQKQGGTIEAIHEMMLPCVRGKPIPLRDLETGEVCERKAMSSFDTIGEAVFWESLDTVLYTPPNILRKAFLTVVKEPGKGRSVTKASACLKIVLDLVNKICAEPLRKGIPSSASGMGKSHHGWQFFLELMSNEYRESLFRVKTREEEEYVDYIARVDTYEDTFFSSTDYEEATDQMSHEFAALAGSAWMRKCGIPAVLRGIVMETCYKPRQIYFTGLGALKHIGTEAPAYGAAIRSVTLVRGILMGDPITKIVLHLSNIVARTLGKDMGKPSFLAPFFTNPFEICEEVKRS